MAIYRYTIYKTPNIGLFVKANDSVIIVPFGFADTKAAKLAEYLQVKEIYASVAGMRLLGPMSVMNNNGILVSYLSSDEEIQALKEATGLNVERLKSKFTAIGNLISTNDNGAIVSSLFKEDEMVNQQVQDVLGVPSHTMSIGGFVQVGAMIVPTNAGAGVHPKATEEEVKAVSEMLQVEAEPVTVNNGLPFLSSGIIGNSKAIVVGTLTSGPELIMLSRAYKA